MSEPAESVAGFAGIDIGGSGYRLRVVTGERSAERRRAVVIPREGGRVDVPHLSILLLGELRSAMAELGGVRLHGLGIGLTGVPALVDSAEFDRLLHDELGLKTLVVASDALTTHVGALEGAGGAVVSAGTGVIALGTDLAGVWNQVDGWGFLLGDEGSGKWIGRSGLQAALRAADGRIGGSEALRSRMLEQFGGPFDLIEHIYPSDSPAQALASFAPAVAETARAGDPVAAAIWNDAGVRLGQAVVAAVRSLAPRVSWGGGLFKVGELLLTPFREEVRRGLPEAELTEPAGTSLDGALLLARHAAAGRLQSHPAHIDVFLEREGPRTSRMQRNLSTPTGVATNAGP